MIFQSFTQDEFAKILAPHVKVKPFPEENQSLRREKKARYCAKQIFHWVYQRSVRDWEEMTDLSKPLRAWLKSNIEIRSLSVREEKQSSDGTHKFLWNLEDGKTVESVVIPASLREKEADEVDNHYSAFDSDEELTSPAWRRLTACISSQVGCAMACKFCLTGVQGFDRHLEAHEIVSQVYELRKRAPITNIVFMGMGEPLHNLKNIIQACRILVDDDGMNFSKRKVTVSTSGIVPAIRELGKSIDVSLAISLNASQNEQRDQIMPVNKKWPIEELLGACREYPLGKQRSITFEYVLLKDFNDSIEDAKRVLKLTRGVRSKVNLIPFNEHPGSQFKRPESSRVFEFQDYLAKNGVRTTVRISRGRDILAACGQLRSIFGTARGSDRHRDWAEPQTAS